MIPLSAWLCVSLALAAIGLACLVARRTVAHAWMGTALLLQAAALNFAAFAQASADPRAGRELAVFALFLMAVEAAAALALAARLARGPQVGPLDRLRE